MKQFKKQNFNFYVTWDHPNGTNDLIITDRLGQILEVFENFLMSPESAGDSHGSFYAVDGEQVMFVEDLCEHADEFSETYEEYQVFQILFEDVLESIASSPVRSSDEAQRDLISCLTALSRESRSSGTGTRGALC